MSLSPTPKCSFDTPSTANKIATPCHLRLVSCIYRGSSRGTNSFSLLSLSSSAHAPNHDTIPIQDERRQRKRNLIYLINQYLGDYLPKTQRALKEEYKCDEYQVCDNIDLDSMYLEYCSLFQIKFGKKPKILKRLDTNGGTNSRPGGGGGVANQRNGNALPRQTSIKKETDSGQVQDMEGVLKVSSTTASHPSLSVDEKISLNGNTQQMMDFDCFPEEWKDIAENICRMIVQDKFDVSWSNVHGAGLAKNVLRESVILPLQRPDLFNTIRPWRSALLHGPPGTGKTLMAKALATECFGRVTFFNVHSSAITSKWRGESEKYIRVC